MAESPEKMYAIATIMTILAVLAVGLRFWARLVKKSGLSWDDYMTLPALLFTIATAICMFIGSAKGDLARHVQMSKIHKGHPIRTHRVEVFEQIEFATLLAQVLTFGFTKLSVLLFYKRIFQGPIFRAALWTMICLTFVWTVAFFFSELLQCIPLSVNWSGFGSLYGQCLNVNMMIIAQAWSDVAMNIIILALPIVKIFELQLPVGRKLGVCAIFLLGALTVGSGIAKLVIYYRAFDALNTYSVDITYLMTPFVYWPMVESSLGIVGACLPLMRPLLTGAASPGFMRKLRTVDTPSDGGSDTLFDHSQVAKSTGGWNSTLSTFQFGSASSASTKLGSISMPFGKHKSSVGTSSERFGNVSPMDTSGRDATYALPKPRPVVRTHPLDNLGVLNDDFPFENGQKIDGIV